MPIQYCINRDESLIEETWSGKVSAADLRSYWQVYLADPEVMRLRKTLVDLRGAKIEFLGHELDALIASVVLPALGELEWKTAIVVNNPVHYGVSRQYQVFAERYSQDAIFHDLDIARAWLNGAAAT